MATHRDPTSPVVTYHSTLCARLTGFGDTTANLVDTTARIRPVFHGDASKTKDGHTASHAGSTQARSGPQPRRRPAAPGGLGGLGSVTFDTDPQILNTAASR